MTATIRFDAVSKSFDDVVALSDVTFDVADGMTALLGPNGAGKSTIMRLTCGMTRPSDGHVQVLGRPPRGDPALYRQVGIVPQQEELLGNLGAHEFVAACAELSGVADPGAAATTALHRVDLDPAEPRPLKTYSKGMRQRVKLAQAIAHDPALLVLDEPLNGLDPRQRLRMIELFRDLASEGRTVLVSSHVLEEVERFGSRILLVVQGRLVAEGDFHDIRDAMDDRPRHIRVRTDDPRGLASGLLAAATVDGVSVEGEDLLFVDTGDVASFRTHVAGVARDVGARLYEVVPLDESLESVFRYLVMRRRV